MTFINTAITAIVAKLNEAPAVSSRVERVRLRALPTAASAAVVVRPLQADVLEAQLTTGYPISWDHAIAVEVYSRAAPGTSPDAAVDTLLGAVYQRLLTDSTLGGAVVVLQPQRVSFDFDVDGEQTVCATLTLIARQKTVGATL